MLEVAKKGVPLEQLQALAEQLVKKLNEGMGLQDAVNLKGQLLGELQEKLASNSG